MTGAIWNVVNGEWRLTALKRPGSEADKCPQCEGGADISAETPPQPGFDPLRIPAALANG